MTLQASGAISVSDINVELQRSSTATLGIAEPDARYLSKQYGSVSMSGFYGKTYLTTVMATDWLAANKATAHNWVFGGSGDTRYVNNPYDRYTSSTNWTYNPSFSGITSNTTTIIVITLENGAGVPSVTTNLGSGTQSTVYSTGFSGGFNAQKIIINSDIKNITSISSTWNHSNSNAGTWASCLVVPGTWQTSSTIKQGDVSLFGRNIIIGGSTSDVGDGPQYSLTNANGMPYQYFSAWWYNSCGHWMVVNNSNTIKNANLTGETYSVLLNNMIDP